MHRINHIILPLLMAAGCASQPGVPERGQADILPDTVACLDVLSGTPSQSSPRLDNTGFNVVNWNIQKGKHEAWAEDMRQLHDGADLLILQEAPEKHDDWDELAPRHHRSFAEGFGLNHSLTGVLTMSRVEPLSECRLVALEPWFLTRKATLITEYALTGTPATLLVINIHSINFSIGVKDMEKQLQQAAAIVDHHEGPVLLSGDFNTWHSKREKILEALTIDLGLAPLTYEADHRKRWLGRAIDHIYVRDLKATGATTKRVDSSDHNPMTVKLSYSPDPRRMVAAP